MKPKPMLWMHSATASGPTSIRPPRASSTSAEPHWLVAERLPCFATRQPAPAAMNAAVGDTLEGWAAAPRPGGVDEVIAGIDLHRQLSQRGRQARDLRDGLALGAQRDQKRGRLRL